MRLTKAAQRGGAMVALYPSPEVAQRIAQPGGEAAEDLHLTVLHLGLVEFVGQPERLALIIQAVAAQTAPLDGEIAGVGHFTEGDGVDVVTWASADVPGLDKLRAAVCEAVDAAGFKTPSQHGFTPHITLDDQRIEPDLPNLPLSFDRVSLVIGGERTDFPLTGVTAADRSDMKLLDRLLKDIDKADYSTEQRIQFAREGKAIPIKEDGKIVGGRYPIDSKGDLDNAVSAYGRASDKAEAKAHILRQAKRLGATDALPEDWSSSEAEKSEHVEVVTALWKDDAQQIVYGIVMQPDVRDSAGDWQSAGDIEKAAHRYMAESRLHDVQHAEEPVQVIPVESFIAHQDMEYAGKPVLKGSWVMAVKVEDADVWGQVTKGELTGFSIGGTAIRQDDD